METNPIVVAMQYIGLTEQADYARLMRLFRNADLIVDPRTTPWCAAFVNAVETLCGRPGTKRLNARSFLLYGEEVDIDQADQGDILIFSRGNDQVHGHVTYLNKWLSDETVECLGGNQGDRVCCANYPASRIIGARRCR